MLQNVTHSTTRSASAIYNGMVRHRRFSPVTHDFQYRIAMLMLDLDFVDAELDLPPLMSTSVFSAGWFRRKDYAGTANTALKQHILDQVEQKTGNRPDGKVLLLTHLRYWGFVMNPISIFYCYDLNSRLVASVLQVTNTPWREKVLYVLPANSEKKNQVTLFPKEMHVSPFNPMDMQYLCRLQNPDKSLFFHLENHAGNEKVTDATMVFRKKKMTRWQLIKLILMQPAMTVRVGFGIYWQALRLWAKGVPVFDHPGNSRTPDTKLKSTTTIRHSE